MTCAYCNLVFEAGTAHLQCAGCGLHGGCRRVRCPRCGYEMPEELGIVKRLAAWRQRTRIRRNGSREPTGDGPAGSVRPTVASAKNAWGTADGATPIPLAAMRPGTSGVVVDLRGGAAGQVPKCLALGILPGASITLRKRSPSFVFDIGFSQFAVDESMANAVLVQPSQG